VKPKHQSRTSVNLIGLLVVILGVALNGGCNGAVELEPRDVRKFFHERGLVAPSGQEAPNKVQLENLLRELLAGASGFDEVCRTLRLHELARETDLVCYPEWSSVNRMTLIHFELSHYNARRRVMTVYYVAVGFEETGELWLGIVPAKSIAGQSDGVGDRQV
jgi:hypothetical protein